MVWDLKKKRLQNLIAADSGILRVRSAALDRFAQKRAREIKEEIDPNNPTQKPSHRGWQLGDPVTPTTWQSYWDELPDFVNTFGENLTWNYLTRDSVQAAATGWKLSPPHWANETNLKFQRIGIGITRRVLEGDENNPLLWRWFYVAFYTN